MPTFERADRTVEQLADTLIDKYESHKPLAAVPVKVDFVFARADVDDNGEPINDALSKNGIKALGICRKMPLKDRAMGRGDAEVCLDGDWWAKASPEEQAALLDHELHHIAVKMDKHGRIAMDDLGRPQLKLRKHDIDVGWFSCIAQRHGAASLERIQAKSIMDNAGQFYWPDLAPSAEIEFRGEKSKVKKVDAFAKLSAPRI